MTEKKPETSRAVSSIKAAADVATSLEKALTTLSLLENDFTVGGIAYRVVALVVSLLQCIRSGRNDQQTIDAADQLGCFLIELEACLTNKPFDTADVEGLTKLAQKFQELQERVESLMVSETQLRQDMKTADDLYAETSAKISSNNNLLEEKLSSQEARIAELEGQLQNAPQPIDLDKLGPTLDGYIKLLASKLEFNELREDLQHELDELRYTKSLEIGKDVASVRTLMTLISQASESVRTKTAPLAVEKEVVKVKEFPSSVFDVQEEIERRIQWLSSVSEQIQTDEDAIVELQKEILKVESDLGFARTEAARKRLGSKKTDQLARQQHLQTHKIQLMDGEASVQAQLKNLRSYQAAMQLIDKGLDMQAITSDLPVVPKLPEFVPASKTLATIAEKHGLSEGSVLMITLYDSLPNNRDGGSRRSPLSLLTLAKDGGLLADLGISDELAKIITTADDLSVFLQPTGKDANKFPTFCRTKTPLPWKTEDIISAEQLNKFLNEYADYLSKTRKSR